MLNIFKSVCVERKTLLASCNLKVAIICLNHTVKKSESYNESHAQYRRHESHLFVPPSIIWQFDFLGGSKPAMITSSRDSLTHGVPLLRHYQFVIFRNQNIFFMKHACCKWPFGINSFPFYFGKTTTRWMQSDFGIRWKLLFIHCAPQIHGSNRGEHYTSFINIRTPCWPTWICWMMFTYSDLNNEFRSRCNLL